MLVVIGVAEAVTGEGWVEKPVGDVISIELETCVGDVIEGTALVVAFVVINGLEKDEVWVGVVNCACKC